MTTQHRSGFTLFQLLVILALLAILFAMLLPAVVKVRQAAQRTQSINSLKQIALACHNYHDVNGRFPSGNDPNNFSAAAHLLPYIEQDNLYKQIDFKKPMTDPVNQPWRKTTIKVFLSPRDPLMVVENGFGATNYLYSAGSKMALSENDGIFYQDSKLRIADITDGTSNTIMAGETLKGDGTTKAADVRRQHVALDKEELANLKPESGASSFKDNKNIAGNRCASWMDGRFLQGTFTATLLANDPRPDVTCGGMGGLSALRSLEDNIGVAFCDGSVRAIMVSKVNAELWKALATRAGGEVVALDF